MSFILLVEQVAPETPSTNQVVLYPKSDGLMYSKDDAGTERAIAVGTATTTEEGVVELATQAEMDAGTAAKIPTADLNKISLGSAVATTSGASVSLITGLPAGVREVECNLAGVSSSGTSNWQLQFGPSGGVETTGYAGATGTADNNGGTPTVHSAGILLAVPPVAAGLYSGWIRLTLLNASTNLWSYSFCVCRSDTATIFIGAGSKALAGAIDQVSLTTAGGSDTFDAGSANVNYKR